jgi:hypothetical protein
MSRRGGLVVLLLGWSLLASCGSAASCRDRTVSSQPAGDMEIKILHRECGSAAGYMLSIAPPGLDTHGHAAEFEPFSVLCNCRGSGDQNVPFDVRIGPDNTIVVHYDPSSHVRQQRANQGRFKLEYVPRDRRP